MYAAMAFTLSKMTKYLKRLNSFFNQRSVSSSLKIQTDPQTILYPTTNHQSQFESDINDLQQEVDLLSVRSDVSIEIPHSISMIMRNSDLISDDSGISAILAQSESHIFDRRNSGPSVVVPVRGPWASQRGRFSVVREEIESSIWGTKVRNSSLASRFYSE